MTLEISREDMCETLAREFDKSPEYFKGRMRRGSLSEEQAERVLQVKKKVDLFVLTYFDCS